MFTRLLPNPILTHDQPPHHGQLPHPPNHRIQTPLGEIVLREIHGHNIAYKRYDPLHNIIGQPIPNQFQRLHTLIHLQQLDDTHNGHLIDRTVTQIEGFDLLGHDGGDEFLVLLGEFEFGEDLF